MSDNEACRESEIKSGLNRLEGQGQELLNELRELSKRLTSVLRPEPQEKQPTEPTSKEMHTSLGQQIATIHAAVSDQVEIVCSILKRLEV